MKKILIIVALLSAICIQGYGQTDEAAQLLLNVEKLAQFKQILSDMKKGYDVVSKGYNGIKDISEGNFNLHKAFLDALMEVSPAVKKYKRIGDIINCQVILVKEYKSAFARFKSNGNFDPDEVEYMGRVYNNLFKRSLENLDDLSTVVTANKLRMSDDERISEIDRIHADMKDKLVFLRSFNNRTAILALQRTKEKNDAASIKQAYGIKK